MYAVYSICVRPAHVRLIDRFDTIDEARAFARFYASDEDGFGLLPNEHVIVVKRERD